MKKSALLLAAWTTFALVSDGLASDCLIDGVITASSSNAPVLTSTNATFGGSVCGHTVSVRTTGTCYIKIDSAGTTASSSTCLTVGRGVDLNGNGSTISCSDASCGDAVLYNPSLGSGSTDVHDLHIDGCFTRAAVGSSSSSGARSLTDVTIDMAGYGGCQGTYGALYWDTIERTKISNAAGHAVSTDGLVKTSGFYGNAVGILAQSGLTAKNLLFSGNTVSIKGSGGTLDSSALLYSVDTSCHCKPSTTCSTDLSDCVSPAGDDSFVNDDFFP